MFLSSFNQPLRRHLNKRINFMIKILGKLSQKREWFADLEWPKLLKKKLISILLPIYVRNKEHIPKCLTARNFVLLLRKKPGRGWKESERLGRAPGV